MKTYFVTMQFKVPTEITESRFDEWLKKTIIDSKDLDGKVLSYNIHGMEGN